MSRKAHCCTSNLIFSIARQASQGEKRCVRVCHELANLRHTARSRAATAPVDAFPCRIQITLGGNPRQTLNR